MIISIDTDKAKEYGVSPDVMVIAGCLEQAQLAGEELTVSRIAQDTGYSPSKVGSTISDMETALIAYKDGNTVRLTDEYLQSKYDPSGILVGVPAFTKRVVEHWNLKTNGRMDYKKLVGDMKRIVKANQDEMSEEVEIGEDKGPLLLKQCLGIIDFMVADAKDNDEWKWVKWDVAFGSPKKFRKKLEWARAYFKKKIKPTEDLERAIEINPLTQVLVNKFNLSMDAPEQNKRTKRTGN